MAGKYKYKITYTLGNAQSSIWVRPNDNDFRIRRTVDGYRKRKDFASPFVFYNDRSSGIQDFDTIKNIEQYDPFTTISFEVYTKQNQLELTGYFSPADCKFDDDRCLATVTPNVLDEYTCIFDNWEKEENILQVPKADPFVIINPLGLEYFTCEKEFEVVHDTLCHYPLDHFSVYPDPTHFGLPFDDAPAFGGQIVTDTHPFYLDNVFPFVISSSCFYTPAFPYVNSQNFASIYESYRIISNRLEWLNTVGITDRSRFRVKTTWAIEATTTLNDPLTNNPVVPSGGGWIAIESTTLAGQNATKWGRIPFYVAQNYVYYRKQYGCNGVSEYELVNPITTNSAYRFNIYRGRKLTEVIQWYLDKYCPGLSLVSEFLNSSINPITGEQAVQLILNNCSDIKDPDSTEPATMLFLKLEDLLNNICAMFDLDWYISGSNLIIEHIKYFESGFSYTTDQTVIEDARQVVNNGTGVKEIVNTNNYAYNSGEIYATEKWQMGQYLDFDFSPLAIDYEIGKKNDRVRSKSIDFITDVTGVISNPSQFDNKSVVITAHRPTLTNPPLNLYENVVINEEGYRTGEEVTNGFLSLSNLFNRFYRYRRIRLFGNLGDQSEEFITQSNKKIQEITVTDCDKKYFDADKIITNLGTGRALDGEHKMNLGSTTITIEL